MTTNLKEWGGTKEWKVRVESKLGGSRGAMACQMKGGKSAGNRFFGRTRLLSRAQGASHATNMPSSATATTPHASEIF